MKSQSSIINMYESLLVGYLGLRLRAKGEDYLYINEKISEICGKLENLYNKGKKNDSTKHNTSGKILPTRRNNMGRYM